ncbi:hypothetical protein FHS18_003185 [Paenibacillus phyllosphaerae]|uniref:ABC-2 family transporter protein n=1 Tax=Paenibacillus phyllosphaerae TaxID=274593 RepID=A0A7W5FNG4_9BACL|nr:hypothetical protein [Paenibacillus phyllosphaerae]MBB3111117.1 hypothetical protein [Paenibacillus phyllosphaerae]
MNRYLKLVHMELGRAWKPLAALMGLTLVMQLAIVVYLTRNRVAFVKRNYLEEQQMSVATFVQKIGRISFNDVMMDNMLFTAPIVLGIVVLLLYTLFLWYRDWLGKNMFIYRLLMLPSARSDLYFAKLTTVLLLVFSLVAFQMAILPLLSAAFAASVPYELRESVTAVELASEIELLTLVLPFNWKDFLLYYGFGMAGVAVLYACVLLERSYKIVRGIAGMLVYLAIIGLLLFLPAIIGLLLFLPAIIDVYWMALYPWELITLQSGLVAVVGALSVWLSLYLMKHKITV